MAAPVVWGSVLAGLSWANPLVAQDDLNGNRTEAPQESSAPADFLPPDDAQPIWLPRRPVAKVTPVQRELPTRPASLTSSDVEPALEPIPQGAVTEESPTPAIRVSQQWQSGVRWRVRPSPETSTNQLAAPTNALSSPFGDENTTPRTSAIRRVSQLESTSALNDPFGDGQRPAPPTGNQPPNNLLPPAGDNQFNSPSALRQPRPQTAEDPDEGAPALRRLNREDNNVPRYQPPPTNGSNMFRPADPRMDGKQPVAQCDRVYNDRDCCDEDRKRSFVRTKLKELTISKISLDITPAFKPNSDNRRENEARKRTFLETAPSKTWHNRTGEVVATGRIVDFQMSRVIVADESGEKKLLIYQDLCDDDLCFVSAWWGLPAEFALGDDPYIPRNWVASTMTWKATSMCNKPLYFEETQLERYGHTTGPFSQPFVSGAHFFLNVAALPYKMAINPPNECMYPLGYYRPGNCAPWLLPPIPISLRGAIAEAGVVVPAVLWIR